MADNMRTVSGDRNQRKHAGNIPQDGNLEITTGKQSSANSTNPDRTASANQLSDNKDLDRDQSADLDADMQRNIDEDDNDDQRDASNPAQLNPRTQNQSKQ